MALTYEDRLIQLGKDTAANWTSNNPTLLSGEIGIETDTGSIKIGDGSTSWTSLSYYDGGLANSTFLYSIPDSSCQVARASIAPTITTSYQYGAVDLVKMKAGGTVGAGTLIQGTTIGKKLKSAKASGVTLTGSGAVYSAVYINAKDAIEYKNLTCSVQAKVYHDVGSDVNYYIYVNKANSADTFSAVTNISTSAAIAVTTGTSTVIKLEGISMGDCTNGIQIEIKSDCGAVTTKNFEFTDFQINIGSKITTYRTLGYDLSVSRANQFVRILSGNCLRTYINTGSYWQNDILYSDGMYKSPSLNLTYLGTYDNDAGAASANTWKYYYNQTGAYVTWAVAPTTINSDVTSINFTHTYVSGTTPSVTMALGDVATLCLGSGSHIILDSRF